MRKPNVNRRGAFDAAVYRDVIGGLLEIDTDGRIWRVATRRGRPHLPPKIAPCERRRAEYTAPNGYMHVLLWHARTAAHRLVWIHFNGPIPEGLTINHKDGIHHHNHPDNLELATMSEQQRHSVDILGNRLGARGEAHPSAKLAAADIAIIRERRAAGEQYGTIAIAYGVSGNTIGAVCRHKTWRVLCHKSCRECAQ